MPLLLLSPRAVEDGTRLADAAAELGWASRRLTSWRIPTEMETPESVAIYGEPLFARIVANQLGKKLLEPTHDWLTKVPHAFRRRTIAMHPFGQCAVLHYPCFIKPPDDKLFPAKVYASASDLPHRPDLAPDQPVLVSEPVRFTKEFRCHLLHGRVVSFSRYSRNGDLLISADDPDQTEAHRFCQDLADSMPRLIPPAVVVDVGLLESAHWAVVEANPCFGAGIYAGDPAAILPVLLEACRPAAETTFAHFTFPVELE
ncbi:ATP-grasp domain-containing protein [Acanthopleuribacter pedis]|uniref:ATP-grasp domain-containing protein n=1 Tax=Acanthopleuribacter pedis TaxID=442870 RepID=A0A8J7QRZ7_9BACT|nr:ATP-grasp domain-containing protein [Acanthopleuribacter pedis]MBO1323170.1 ATP-grasp domain-containing protein [Acanthopleuribacter pedis]